MRAYDRLESAQICTRLCTSIGDSAPPLKKREGIERRQKKCWHFYRFSEFVRLVAALLSPRLMLLSSGRARELVAIENSWKLFLNCFWAGDSRQSTHTNQDSSLYLCLLSLSLSVCECVFRSNCFCVLFLFRWNNGFRSFLTRTCLFNPVLSVLWSVLMKWRVAEM